MSLAFLLQHMPTYSTQTRFTSMVQSIDHFVFDKVLKACFITRKDVAKECTKIILPFIVPSHVPYARQCTGYGCEAAWTCYFDGPSAIPGSLVRYTCVNACYDQLCNGLQYCNIEYPQRIRDNSKVYAISRVIMPMLAKHGLGIIIKALFNFWWHDEPQDDDDAMNEDKAYLDFYY